MKYTNTGLKHFPIPSDTLNIKLVKFGVILACINNGIIVGDIKFHFVTVSGINKLIIIVIIINNTISNIPDNCKLPINSINLAPITVPKLVHSIIAGICDAKNINTNKKPKFSKLFDK